MFVNDLLFERYFQKFFDFSASKELLSHKTFIFLFRYI